jgi:succinoglycan biosynthesis transport protein ExoP
LATLVFTNNSVTTIVRGVMRWWKQSASVFAFSFAVVVLVALVLPNQYKSNLKILVKNERANSLISVGDQTQGLLYLNDVSEARINTEIELLNSGDLLRRVVKRCHLADMVNPRVKSSELREEIAVVGLRKALTVAPAHRSDVIAVSYQSNDPKRSAQVLEALSEIYMKSHLELHGAPGSFAFYDKLWKDSSNQLSAAETELANFKQSTQIVSLPEEKSILLQHVSDLQKELAQSAAVAKKSEREASSYKDSMDHLSASIEKERKLTPNQGATEQLGALLVTLQNKREEAVTRYQPSDRIFDELDAQIKVTQGAMEKALDSPAEEVVSAANPIFMNAESDFVRTRAEYVGRESEAASLRSQIVRDQGRLAALGAASVSYDDLVRRSSELNLLTETYRKKRDEARVGELLDQQNLSNIAIVEQPVVESIAASPRRGIIVSLGFVWSLSLAAGIAVILDLMNRRINSSFELEKSLGVPVLAVLPDSAETPFFDGSFPELYLAMQRTTTESELEAL